jgi:hypothetical protein
MVTIPIGDPDVAYCNNWIAEVKQPGPGEL